MLVRMMEHRLALVVVVEEDSMLVRMMEHRLVLVVVEGHSMLVGIQLGTLVLVEVLDGEELGNGDRLVDMGLLVVRPYLGILLVPLVP